MSAAYFIIKEVTTFLRMSKQEQNFFFPEKLQKRLLGLLVPKLRVYWLNFLLAYVRFQKERINIV